MKFWDSLLQNKRSLIQGMTVLRGGGGRRASVNSIRWPEGEQCCGGSPFKREKREHARVLWQESACGLGQYSWRESGRKLGQTDGKGVLEIR